MARTLEPTAAQRTATPAARSIVNLEGVSKRFGAFTALHPLTLAIAQGEFFALLGSSGSGKTTTLRIIAGFEQPDSGRVLLAGRDVTAAPPYERDVNTVFQDYALFPHMSVWDNIAYGLRARRVAKPEIARRVDEMLGMVRLSEFGARKPAQLSGGQRQRVALARALVNLPAVLLLDEPLGALDLQLRREMQLELKRIQQRVGITFVYVTHDQDEALSMSDRLAVMSAGRLVQVGTPREVYDRPATAFVATFVGSANMLPNTQASADGELLRLDAPGFARLLVPTPPGWHPGAPLTFGVRPEKLRLFSRAEDAPPAHNCVCGLVREGMFTGTSVRYSVQVGAHEWTVVEPNASAFSRAAPGDAAFIAWHPADGFALLD